MTDDNISASKEQFASKLVSGPAWMVSFRLIDRLLGVLSMLILARLLVPDDFGVVAMAMSFVALLETLGELGFEVALIQRQDASPDLYHTAWTVRICLALMLALILYALRYEVADFYLEPRLVPLMPVLALAIVIQGSENIGVANFRKELRFAKEFRFQLFKRLASVIVTIVLAVLMRSYWALIIGVVVSRSLGLVLSYLMHPFRPRFKLKEFRELIRFVSWLFLTNIVSFINSQLANFVVGKSAGAGALGAYRIAFELAMLPTAYIMSPINRALFPAYSIKAASLDELRHMYLQVMSVTILFVVPAGLGMMSVADLAVHVGLGPQWESVGRLLQSLSIFALTVALLSNIGPVLVALGKPKLGLVLTLAFVVVLIPTLTFLTFRNGAVGAADAYAISGLVVIPLNYWLIGHELKIGVIELIKIFIRPTIASVVMVASIFMLLSHSGYDNSIAAGGLLLIAIAGGAAIYASAVILLWIAAGRIAGPEAMLLAQIRRRLGDLQIGRQAGSISDGAENSKKNWD